MEPPSVMPFSLEINGGTTNHLRRCRRKNRGRVPAAVFSPHASITHALQLLRPAEASAPAHGSARVGLTVEAAKRFVTKGSSAPLRRHLGSASGGAATSQHTIHLQQQQVLLATATAARDGAVAAQRGLHRFLAGGVAGAVSKTMVAPLERISTMLMADGGGAAQRLSLGEAARTAARDGGLFRGNSATVLKVFPASAIQFAVFHGLKDACLGARARRQSGRRASAASPAAAQQQQQQQAGGREELSNGERLLAGAAAGAASVAACYPLETVRTWMQVAATRGGVLQVGRAVVAQHGVGALYRGARAALLGDTIGNALGFTLYEAFNTAYRDRHGSRPTPPHLRGCIGAASAACVLTLTMPLEVVRRRLQAQGIAGRPVLYRGVSDCLRQIARREGVAAFYAAALPSLAKVAPSIGIMYFMFELLVRE